MPVAMPYDPTKRKLIQDYMKRQEDDAGGKDKLRHDKFEIKGKVYLEPIYEFNHKELAFNKANGRIHAETIEKEAELGRLLDIWNKDDQNIIKDLLLSIRKDENEKVKKDLFDKGQIRPGIITCDGIVINGNRRKALLDELYEETKKAKYKYLEAHVLPSNITKSELWLIEAGIQMSAPQQLEYSPINNLLKLKDGILSGLRIEDMASRIYGVTIEDIRTKLERLDLIDEYLTDFIGKPGKYYLVRGLVEHFIDLQNRIAWAKNPRGPIKRDWSPDDNDINELKIIGFYFIRGGFKHLRIRELRDLFTKAEIWGKARETLNVHSNLDESERIQAGLKKVAESEENEDEEIDEIVEDDYIKSIIEERDLEEEKAWRIAREPQLKAIFEDSMEQYKIRKDSERPIKLIQRALNNLDAIPLDPEKLKDPAIDIILGHIINTINSLRKITRQFRD
jgi:hypothetical protein